MSFTLMEYASELLRRVEAKIDQPDGYIGEPSWNLATRVDAVRDAYSHIWGEVSNLDSNFGVKRDTSLTITSGASTLTLPSDLRTVDKILEIDSNGDIVPGGELPFGTVNDAASSGSVFGIYEPDDGRMWFPRKPTRDIPVLVRYGYWPQPLAHGIARAATATTIQLDTHESIEDDVHVGQTIFIYEGNGIGESKVITAYDGATRQATITGTWTNTPAAGSSKYTMRPLLPRDATDALVYEICGRLLEILEDERYPAFYRARSLYLRRMEETLRKRDRRVARHIRNDAGYNHRDPYRRGYMR